MPTILRDEMTYQGRSILKEALETMVIHTNCLKLISGDFPGSPVIRNLPYSSGGAGSIPGTGTKIPCDTAQLSPQVTATEPLHPGAAPQLEGSLSAATKTQHSQK